MNAKRQRFQGSIHGSPMRKSLKFQQKDDNVSFYIIVFSLIKKNVQKICRRRDEHPVEYNIYQFLNYELKDIKCQG